MFVKTIQSFIWEQTLVKMAIVEPEIKRAMAFFDGQNLYRHAKDAFGHHHPNYDPLKLHAAVCAEKGWISNQVRFYTGVPNAIEAPMWAPYWSNRGILLLGGRRAIRLELVRL